MTLARWIGKGALLAGCLLAAVALFSAGDPPAGRILAPLPEYHAPEGASLVPPAVGTATLRVLTPLVLELCLITGEEPPLGGAAGAFRVVVNGAVQTVKSLGVKRRVRYAHQRSRDLRIASATYLELSQPVPEQGAVLVSHGARTFTATAAPTRFSPVIHVNQEGYRPGYPKRAFLGYYLGTAGELDVPVSGGFSVVDLAGTARFRGNLSPRREEGTRRDPPPYQRVLEADFSRFDRPGHYRLQVPGLGVSLPFEIRHDLAGGPVRAFALGLYHQRCGSANALPYTRFLHGACHLAPAAVPDGSERFANTDAFLSGFTKDAPATGAPRLTGVGASLFPILAKEAVDVRGGHHDAGDYSKYMINSAQLVHYLCFAADNIPVAGPLDNLGLPESGDGKPDLLQLAMWEADYMVRAQDADGGFFFLIYPRDEKYEWKVTPDHGLPQVVWPKNSAATAAATAALAQLASSPLMQREFPAASARYRAAALKGWAFLERAWARHGRTGSYQYVTHYGSDFDDRDEVAWCETEMYLLTRNPAIQAQLLHDFDPADPTTVKWSWWHLFESYGAAIRDYAFAERSGRVPAGSVDRTMLAKCLKEIQKGGQDQLAYARASAYGTSYSLTDKRWGNAAWYQSSAAAFDMAVAGLIEPKDEYIDAMLTNINYEEGCNPNNVSFVTGMGWNRQSQLVNQYWLNARHSLPPSGLPIGNVVASMPYLAPYGTALRERSFPPDTKDGGPAVSYGIYDRWCDCWNVQTEMVTCLAARGLATALALASPAGLGPTSARQPVARIEGVPPVVPAGTTLTPVLQVDGNPVLNARIVWEAAGADPIFGESAVTLVAAKPGPCWLEAEAQCPDGRRFFAVCDFTVR